ncbi:MAG: MBL fold metallo-hydrolase, partial [Oscillospiraceae bacterium]
MKKISESPEIWSIDVPLPDNPLKNLNCYVIRSGGETLVIDTGFRQSECAVALFSGLRELQVDFSKTKLYLTHLHSDHSGLAEDFSVNGSEVFMSQIDYDLFHTLRDRRSGATHMDLFGSEGFPPGEGLQQATKNPAIVYAPMDIEVTTLLTDGMTLPLGDLQFECIHTPGHTPGHFCLYLPQHQIMFLGDHVLFDITPNINVWPGVKNSLLDYLNSLDKIGQFPIQLALPAHRNNDMDVYQRIADIRAHHHRRLENTLEVIRTWPDMTAYDIAAKMKWKM